MRSYVVSVLLLAAAFPALAQVYTVDTTSDDDRRVCSSAPADCTLRGAMALTNGAASAIQIVFDIPTTDPGCDATSGVCTIRPRTPLPPANANESERVLIDGYTQPGAAPNTLPAGQGLDTRIRIELDGSQCVGSCNGIAFVRPGTVRGLAIGNFRTGNSGISFGSIGSGGQVEGCFVGTDASGTVARPNSVGIVADGNPFGGAFGSLLRIGGTTPGARNLVSGNESDGINLSGAGHRVLGNLVGTDRTGLVALPNSAGVRINGGVGFWHEVGDGTAAGRNVISGNTRAGIVIAGAGRHFGSRVRGNFVGTDVSGLVALPNGQIGVEIASESQPGFAPILGAPDPAQGNLIAFNTLTGVRIVAARSGWVVGNRIFGNGQLGIALTAGDNGSAANRLPNDPGDADLPVNRGQNFPEITAYAVSGGSVSLSYRVDSQPPNSTYPLRIEFFKAERDEGRDLLGVDTYALADAGAVRSVTLPIPSGVTVGPDDIVVATATDADGNTSEFSWQPITMTVSSAPNPSQSGMPYEVTVRAVASRGAFRPNGNVRVTDDAGGSCVAPLLPVAAALTSEARCTFSTGGGARNLFLNATHDFFSGPFADADGRAATARVLHDIVLPPEQVSLRGCLLPVREDAGNATIVVTRQGGSNVSVGFEHVAGTATLGVDYNPPPNGTLTWLGTDMTPRTIVVPLINDALDEDVETFRYRLLNPVGTPITPVGLLEVRIIDDERNPDLISGDGFEGPGCPQ